MRAEKNVLIKKKTCVGDIEQTEKWKREHSSQKRHETQEKCKKSCKDDGPYLPTRARKRSYPVQKNKCIQSLLHLGNVRTGLSLTTERKFENLNHSEPTGLRELHPVPISLLVKHKKPAPLRQGSRRNSKSEETETILSDKSV